MRAGTGFACDLGELVPVTIHNTRPDGPVTQYKPASCIQAFSSMLSRKLKLNAGLIVDYAFISQPGLVYTAWYKAEKILLSFQRMPGLIFLADSAL